MSDGVLTMALPLLRELRTARLAIAALCAVCAGDDLDVAIARLADITEAGFDDKGRPRIYRDLAKMAQALAEDAHRDLIQIRDKAKGNR